MQKEWFIYKDSDQQGPFSVSEIEKMIGNGEISPQTLIWRQGMSDWQALEKVQDLDLKKEWYRLKGSEQIGPLNMMELAASIRDGSVSSDTLIWRQGMEDWARLIDVKDFDFQNLLSSFQKLDPKTFEPIDNDAKKKKRKKIIIASIVSGSVIILALIILGVIFVVRSFVHSVPSYSPEGHYEVLDEDMEEILGQKSTLWQDYPDLEQEKLAIEKSLKEFQSALRDKDAEASVKHIYSEKQQAYLELFLSKPEAMASFADVLSDAKISFLSSSSFNSTFSRTAEYSIEIDGYTFYIVFIKSEEGWILYDL